MKSVILDSIERINKGQKLILKGSKRRKVKTKNRMKGRGEERVHIARKDTRYHKINTRLRRKPL